MKISTLTILIFLIVNTLFGQADDTWTAFYDEETTQFGFKDKNGTVKIEPKFFKFSMAEMDSTVSDQTRYLAYAVKFDHIIGIMEVTGATRKGYYLTKSGKIIGRDSLNAPANTLSCENEGFIRFKDPETTLMGLFNRNGEIAVPAEYVGMTTTQNGMMRATDKAIRSVLIDTLGNVLIDNIYIDHTLNLYSLEKTKRPHRDAVRKSFLAEDGSYWSFVDYEKEFEAWIKSELRAGITKESLINASYNTVTIETKDNQLVKSPKEDFVEKNFERVKAGLADVLKRKKHYSVSKWGIDYIIKEYQPEFDLYFDNCGEAKEWKYPLLILTVGISQDIFYFLRTDDGYKLMRVVFDHRR